MTKKMKIGLAAAVVCAVMGVVTGIVAVRYYIDNKIPNFTEKYVLYVYPDMTAGQVMDSLRVNAGVVRQGSVTCKPCGIRRGA